jgi:ABC-2 type transport system ATP-binding protein
VSTQATVVAEDLVKTYPGDVQAVKGISFSVQAGEAFGLLGPNGAGKTTAIGMLNSTVTPSAGGPGSAAGTSPRTPSAPGRSAASCSRTPWWTGP